MYLFSHIPAFPIINAIIKSAYLFCIRLLEAVVLLKSSDVLSCVES